MAGTEKYVAMRVESRCAELILHDHVLIWTSAPVVENILYLPTLWKRISMNDSGRDAAIAHSMRRLALSGH